MRASLGEAARIAVVAIGVLSLANCSSGEPVPKGGGIYLVGKPYAVNGRIYVPSDDPSYRAEGTASWYGPDFHRKQTANGELYDMHAISAAHPTMPLPSYARVTNLDNGRSIIVRVNDRGPYFRDRIIDLSIGTARALNFYGHGSANVRVEYIGPAPLEGSDDNLLLATLREGSPAPAPSAVMLASAKPLLEEGGNGNQIGSVSERYERERARSEPMASTGPQTASAASTDPRTELSGTSYSLPPARNEGPALGLMSGRGLY